MHDQSRLRKHSLCVAVMCSRAPSLRLCLMCAGQSTDLSFLDPINRADTPPKAIQLAAGELSLRVLETRRRLDAGLGPIQDTIQRCRMAGKPGTGPASSKSAWGIAAARGCQGLTVKAPGLLQQQ